MLRWQKRKPIRHWDWDDSKFRRTMNKKHITQCACVRLLHAFKHKAHLYHFVSGDKLLWFVNSFFSRHSEISFYFCYFLNECKTHRYFEWDSSSLFLSFVHPFILSIQQQQKKRILSNNKKNESFTHQINLLNSVSSDMSTPNRWIDDACLCLLFVERKY